MSNAPAQAEQDRPATPSASKPGQKQPPRKWQDRLLPVMVGLLIGLTIFFFAATFLQLAYLHWSILQFPPIDLHPAPDDGLAAAATTFDDKLSARRLEILARMESYLVERRYHQASVLLMSGLWVRYLGFVTGMILALVGASFVLGKLREPVSEIAGKSSLLDFSLKSASPGVILVALGVLLMFTTIVTRQEYGVQDVRVYLSGAETSTAAGAASAPALSPLEAFDTPTPAPTAP